MGRVLAQPADLNETSCRYGPDLERYFSADPELPILDQSENDVSRPGIAFAHTAMPPNTRSPTKMRLYNNRAERLYLNAVELDRFISAALLAPLPIKQFALTMAYTGCRISEARTLQAGSLQLDARVISVRSLKKRHNHVVREIPMPTALVSVFNETLTEDDSAFLWEQAGRPIPRIKAYRWIKHLMAQANITGPRACPRGLRHSYGTRAVLSGVPLHVLQAWMGHASMKTTAIYASVLGQEQLALSDRMWADG